MAVPIIAAAIGAVGLVTSSAISASAAKSAGGSQPQQAPAQPVFAQPTAQPRTATLVRDEVYGRTGQRINQRTGSRGAEPAGFGSKTKLGI